MFILFNYLTPVHEDYLAFQHRPQKAELTLEVNSVFITPGNTYYSSNVILPSTMLSPCPCHFNFKQLFGDRIVLFLYRTIINSSAHGSAAWLVTNFMIFMKSKYRENMSFFMPFSIIWGRCNVFCSVYL